MVQGDILRTNVKIISELLRRKTDSDGSDGPALHHRCLTLAFDRTYLLQGVDIVGLRAGRGFIGEAFNIDSLKTQPIQRAPELSGFLPLRDHQNPYDGMTGFGEEVDEAPVGPGDEKKEDLSWDAADLNYANEVAEFVLFDPSFKSLPRFSCCCVPVAYKTTGMQMIILLGHILQKTEGKVRTIVFDNATSHGTDQALSSGSTSPLVPEAASRHSVFQQDHLGGFSKVSLASLAVSQTNDWRGRIVSRLDIIKV